MMADTFPNLVNISRSCGPAELTSVLEFCEETMNDDSLRIGLFGTSPTSTRAALLGVLNSFQEHAKDGLLPELRKLSMAHKAWRLPIVTAKGRNEVFLCTGDKVMPSDRDTIRRVQIDFDGSTDHEFLVNQVDGGEQNSGGPFVQLFSEARELDGVQLLVANPRALDYVAQILSSDIVCPVLSATALLSQEDRLMVAKMVEMRAGNVHTCLLADAGMIGPEDLGDVLEVLDASLPGVRVIRLDDPSQVREAWSHWCSLKKGPRGSRQERAAEYALPILQASVREAIESSSDEVQKLSKLIDRLDEAEKGMRKHVQATLRMVDKHVMAPMELKAQQELIKFDDKMRIELRVGIDEEPDTATLAKALPYYIQGEWERLWASTIIPLLDNEAHAAIRIIEADMTDRIGSELQRHLSEDEVAVLEATKPLVREGAIDVYPFPPTLPRERWVDDGDIVDGRVKRGVTDVVGTALGIAGGVALVTGFGIAPAGMLAIAGWQVRSMGNEQKRESLLESALATSQSLKAQAEADLHTLVNLCGDKATDEVEASYKSVFAALASMVKTAVEGSEERRGHIEELQDLLGTMSARGSV